MKVKYTLTATYTTNITEKDLKENYGDIPVTIEDAIKTDIENFKDDPYYFPNGAKIDVIGEVVSE
jgi:hypothetical protein